MYIQNPHLQKFFIFIILVVGLGPCCALIAQEKRAMTLDDMFAIKRVTDPQISPDGKWIAFTITVPDKDANSTQSHIWIMPSTGGSAKRLTDNPKQDRHPRWSPDGKWIACESNRNGSYQIYLISPEEDDTKQLTSISTEASQAVWSHDGKYIAFVSSVYPEFSDKPYNESDALNKQKMESKEKSKVKARVLTHLLYRHWDSWVDDLRQHIFVIPVEGGDPRDVTPGDRDAVPTSSTFSAGDDFDFSPDGTELAYTATPLPTREEAWHTNHDIYTVNVTTGERKQITTNPAADGFPRYSPDGKYMAYRAQSRPDFEADRWQLMLLNRGNGKITSLTKNFDSGVESFIWANHSKALIFDAEEKGTKPLWSVSITGNDVKKLIGGSVNGDMTLAADGSMLAFSRNSFRRPNEIFTSSIEGKDVKQVSTVNDDLFNEIDYIAPESVTYTGAAGAKVQMWIIKPPMFDSAKKYPLVYWVHGGPQGAWMDGWSYRWCPEVWAAQGYVLALPNPRGSTGFGQKFTDEISRDWGGKVYTDVMNGVAYMEKHPYIDKNKMAAAGASYGGYMMNWLEGHTDKFKTIICHDGVYNFTSMYGSTEELWFDEWEHGIPWETKDYEKYSPHKYAKNFKTPMLIIHSEKDYRIPITEAMQLFTTLQRKGIPSKFLTFPDENHWVLKPANSEFWHNTIFEWLAGYLK
ncbi:MAG: S9 family peptidase [Bacteroidota bacterium]